MLPMSGSLMGKRLSYETRARMRERKAAKRFPLLAWGGILDQVGVKATWTAEEVQADEARHRQQAEACAARQRAIANARYERERVWLVELVGEVEVRRREAEYERLCLRAPTLAQAHFRADWMCHQVARATGLTPLAVWQAAKSRGASPSPAGG